MYALSAETLSPLQLANNNSTKKKDLKTNQKDVPLVEAEEKEKKDQEEILHGIFLAEKAGNLKVNPERKNH